MSGASETTGVLPAAQLYGATEGAAAAAPTAPRQRVFPIAVSLWTGSFLCALDGTIVANTATRIASELHGELSVLWVATLYLLTVTACQPLYGRASDILGRRTVLLFAHMWFGLGCLLCSMAQTVPQLAVARAIAGVGGGGIPSLLLIVITDVVLLSDRGLYQGYANIVFGIGQLLGGPVGGFMLEYAGWRWMFALQVPLVMVALTLAVFNVPHKHGHATLSNFKALDWLGAACLLATVLCIVLAVDGLVWQYVAGAVVGCGAFWWAECRAQHPMLPPELFMGTLGITASMLLLSTMSFIGPMFLVPVYLQVVQGVLVATSGAIMAPLAVCVLGGSLITGWWTRRTDGSTAAVKHASLQTILVGTAGACVGALALALLMWEYAPHHGVFPTWFLPPLYLSMLFSTVGLGMFVVAILLFIVAVVGPAGQALATGMNYLFRLMGQVMGAAGALAVYQQVGAADLTRYLASVPDGDALLRRLQELLAYAQSGDMPREVRSRVLEIYQKAVVAGSVPALAACGVLAVLAVVLQKKARSS